MPELLGTDLGSEGLSIRIRDMQALTFSAFVALFEY